MAIGIFISLIKIIVMWRTNSLNGEQKKQLKLILFLLLIFYLIGMHEFICNGTDYRKLWAKPFSALLSFFIIHIAFARSSLLIRWGVVATILFYIFYGHCLRSIILIRAINPSSYLALSRGEVYSANPPEWIKTVQETTAYLQDHLKPNEPFFAMPYDPLYYFLTARSSPTRHLIFVVCMHLPPVQEQDVIQSLEQQRIRYVLMSSRIASNEKAVGFFGRDYCPLLKEYLIKNFETVAEFGDWTKEPDWSNYHATMILKRKSSE